MNHPPIDIVIVNYNSTPYLIKCLYSIFESFEDVTATIFVLDNGKDDKANCIKDMFPTVVITQNNKNIGFSAAINQGLHQTRAPYVAVINPDIIVTKVFFQCIINYIEKDPRIGVIGPSVLNSDGTVQGSARNFPNAFTALYGRTSLLTKFFPRNRISRNNILTIDNDGTSPMEVDWVSGACMVVRRKAIEDVGLLDERFFMYWEDADWCRRMWQKGWKVVYFPQAAIYHHVGRSSETRPLRSIYHFHKSAYRLHEKYTRFPLSLFNPLVLAMLALRGIIASVISILKKKKSLR